jgi:hypothetical protein
MVFCCFCLGIAWYTTVKLNANEKKVSGVVTSISMNELIFEDEKQTEYIIQKTDFDFTKIQLETKDQIVVTFEGEILEISPAKFKKVINVEKERG